MRDISDMPVSWIYDHILAHDPEKDHTYIILGGRPMTGKTWLTNKLKTAGYKSHEITEALIVYELVRFRDNRNHYIIDDLEKLTVIVLNMPIRR